MEGAGICPCDGHGVRPDRGGHHAHGSGHTHEHHHASTESHEQDERPSGVEDCRLLCPLVGASDPPQVANTLHLPSPAPLEEWAARPTGTVETVRLTLRPHFLPPPLAPPATLDVFG